MKSILIALALFISYSTFAQEGENIKSGTPTSSGFVFIDGKYIEPPYDVKQKGLAVYINGIKVTKELEMETPPYSYDQRLGVPPCLDKNSSLEDYIKCKEPNQGLPYLVAMFYYYFGKYDYKQAYDSILTYYRTFPNIKNINIIDESYIEVTSYNNETRKELFAFQMKEYSQKWGPNGSGPASKEVMEKKVNQKCRIIKENLLSNYIILYDTEKNKFILLSEEHLIYFYNILNNNALTMFQKKDSLITTLMCDSNLLKSFIEKYQTTPSLDSRIKLKLNSKDTNDRSIGKEINNLPLGKELNIKSFSKEISDKTTGNQNNDLKKGGAKIVGTYSPSKKEIFAYCSGTWDNAFENFEQFEVGEIRNNIENEDYIYNPSNVFNDETPDDDNFGSSTYANLLRMKDAGFLYLSTHQTISGVLLVYATSQAKINEWSGGAQFITAVPIVPPLFGWDASISQWAAGANANWAQTNWEPDLTANNAISILSGCQSIPNGWVSACGGGITFGYTIDSEYEGIMDNNDELLTRMNGEKDASSHREASDAYNYMPDHKYGFNYVANNKVTLCPSPKFFTTIVSGTEDDAYLELDTYCDASQPATLALVPQTITGWVDITNIHWTDVTNGMSKKISFHWFTDQNFKVKMNVNPEYIRSYSTTGEYHRLDFNGEEPIELTPYYYFQKTGFTPNVSFTNQQITGTSVQFNGTCNLGTGANYSWNFGDGTTISTLQNPVHNYTAPGVYSVQLTASGSSVTISTINQVFVVDPSQNTPILDIFCNTYPTPADIDENVNIQASINTGYLFGHNYRYFFEISDNNGFYYGVNIFSTSSMESIDHTFYASGTYRLKVIVFDNTDAALWGYCEQLLTINNPNPCNNFTSDFTYSPSNPYDDQTVYFTEQTSGGTPPYIWTWYFLPEINDNTVLQPGVQSQIISSVFYPNGNPNPKSDYVEGTYPVLLIVSDNGGCQIQTQKNITINSLDLSNYSYGIVSTNGAEYDPIHIRLHDNDDNQCLGHISPIIDGSYGQTVYLFMDSPYRWEQIWWKIDGVVREHIFSNNLSDDAYVVWCDYSWENYNDHVMINNYQAVLFEYPFSHQDRYHVEMDAYLYDYSNSNHFYLNTDKYVEVIDCDLSSQFTNNAITPFNNAVNYIESATSTFASAGSFNLNSSNNLNSYVNQHRVELTACNEIILDGGFVSGANYDFIAGGGFIEPCDGFQSGKKATILSDLNNNNSNNSSNSFFASPNPFNRFIQIYYKITDESKTEINLINSLGIKISQIYEGTESEKNITFDTRSLLSGLYFVELKNHSFSKIIKMIKMNSL